MGKKIINREKLYGKIAEKELVQANLADFLGVSRATLNARLNGHRDFSEEDIYKLYKVFGKDILNL